MSRELVSRLVNEGGGYSHVVKRVYSRTTDPVKRYKLLYRQCVRMACHIGYAHPQYWHFKARLLDLEKQVNVSKRHAINAIVHATPTLSGANHV